VPVKVDQGLLNYQCKWITLNKEKILTMYRRFLCLNREYVKNYVGDFNMNFV